jgi:indolepyruvate ferredoxin oxidoreductase, beta subunit
MGKYDIVLAGLGGQGVMTISQVLAVAGHREGMEVKYFEGTGMTQRGGGVFSFVRFGRSFSPRIPLGRADALISLEISEVASVLHYLKREGGVWTNSGRIDGYYSKLDPRLYPLQEQVEGLVRLRTPRLSLIPAVELAREAGSPQAVNMVMMGAFLAESALLKTEFVTQAIEEANPKFSKLNLEAFWRGYSFLGKEKAA